MWPYYSSPDRGPTVEITEDGGGETIKGQGACPPSFVFFLLFSSFS